MTGVVFDYEVNDKASNKLDNITQKLRNVKREMSDIRQGMNMLRQAGGAVGGAISGGVGGFIGSGGGGGGGGGPISGVQNSMFENAVTAATLLTSANIGAGIAGKVASKLGGGIAGRVGGQVAGGLVGLAVGDVLGGAAEALRPLVSSAKVDNPSSITTKQSYNIKETTKNMMDTYIHPSYSQHFLYRGMYENRQKEIETQVTLESQKRTKEITDSLWMMYRE